MPRTLWLDTALNNDVASGAELLVSLMTGLTAVQTRFDQMTLMRTLIGIDCGYTVHDAGEGSQQFDAGIAIADQVSFAAGSVPDPQTQGEFPTRGWVWRARYRLFGFAADQPTIFTRRLDLDIRARRLLENGEAFIKFSNAAIEGAASTIRVVGFIRQLWLVR